MPLKSFQVNDIPISSKNFSLTENQTAESLTPIDKFLLDIKEGLLSYHVWTILGWYDIRQRYRRSTIGPLWITLSLGITVAAMGILYGKLFHQDLHNYLPYLTSGMVIWSLVSMIVNDSTTVFANAAGIIKQIRLPLSLHILRMITRNLVIFAHNMLVFVVVGFLFHVHIGWPILLFPFALFLWIINALWVGLLLGALCARFRDVTQIIMSMVQILFFVTPVMWRTEALGNHAWLVQINPLSQYFDILRDPLLGQTSPLISWEIALAGTILGWIVTLILFSKYRARVVYWV